jgi:hypothetical protein
MKLARAALLLAAVAFVGLGLGFLIAPVWWASVVEIALPTAMARTDLRANLRRVRPRHRGLPWALRRTDRLDPTRVGRPRPGSGRFGGGRLLGIVLEGTASPLMRAFAMIEVVTAGLAFILLRRLPRTDRQS